MFERDWKNILETVYRINSAEDIETFRRRTLESVRRLIPNCQGFFYIYKLEKDKFVFYNDPLVLGERPLYLDEFSADYGNDEYFTAAAVVSTDAVFRDTDMMPDEQRMQTRWYRDIYARQGIHYALRCHLVRNGSLQGSIDLFRPLEDEDFSDKDVRILKNLARHISLKLGLLMDRVQPIQAFDDTTRRLIMRYRLTARECEAIQAIVAGIDDAEIAEKMCISSSTLKKHVHNAYRKMRVKSRAQLFAVVKSLEDEA